MADNSPLQPENTDKSEIIPALENCVNEVADLLHKGIYSEAVAVLGRTRRVILEAQNSSERPSDAELMLIRDWYYLQAYLLNLDSWEYLADESYQMALEIHIADLGNPEDDRSFKEAIDMLIEGAQ